MSEWITDRRPTLEDSTIQGEFVLIKIGPNTVQGAHYTRVGDYPWRSLSNSIAKHTPGPWKWVEKRYLMWRKFSLLGPNDCEVMSFGVDDSGTMEMVGEEPNHPDACLIAVAPEMLDIIESLHHCSGYWSDFDVPIGIVKRMSKVIAQAKGDNHEQP